MTDNDESHDVFKETEDNEVEPAAEPETEVEAKETEEQQETKESEESKGEEETETPSEETEDDSQKTVPLAALKSERQKRQAAEEKLSKYETQKVPDRNEDPEGYERYMRVEVSRDVMREAHSDYDETIEHFQEMVKVNPELDRLAGEHKNPAKFAYDLAKEDIKIAELQKVAESDDWKEFQKWKKSQPKTTPEDTKSSEQLARNKSALSVPNLNRATSVKLQSHKSEDDDIFAGSAF